MSPARVLLNLDRSIRKQEATPSAKIIIIGSTGGSEHRYIVMQKVRQIDRNTAKKKRFKKIPQSDFNTV